MKPKENHQSDSHPTKRKAIVLCALIACVFTVVVWFVWESRDQKKINKFYAQGIHQTALACTQILNSVFGEDGLAAVSEPLLGVRQYDTAQSEWVPLSDITEQPITSMGERVVILVHGLDEPGGIWDELAPALAQDGHTVMRFDYANDQAIRLSADQLTESLIRLKQHGVQRVDFVCHSMGGLVTRDAFTREDFNRVGVEIEHYITLGTPHYGSPWARLRAVSEMREQVQRWAQSDDLHPTHLLGFARDGVGQAGEDLLPGSEFLENLNARLIPDEIEVTCVVARTIQEPTQTPLLSLFADGMLAELIGDQDARIVRDELHKLADELGDGVVPMSSAVLNGADHVIHVEANHRSMIRSIEIEELIRSSSPLPAAQEPPAIQIVRDQLANKDQNDDG